MSANRSTETLLVRIRVMETSIMKLGEYKHHYKMLIVMNLIWKCLYFLFSQHLYADYIPKNLITSPISVSDNQGGQFL